MKGADSLLATARAAGIDVCFANPGTTEMPLVEAFDEAPGIRTVLGLSEGVVTGAADGYARMRGGPAMTLLHLGPGLANGIANLHNARRARTPMINVVGEHASWHQFADAPLSSDIDSLAQPVSGWVGRTSSPRYAAAEFADAWHATLVSRLPSTLIAAADHMWSRGGAVAELPAVSGPSRVDPQQVTAVAKTLANSARPAVLLGGDALNAEGITNATKIASAYGGEVFAEMSPARVERGPDIPRVRPMPYFPEDILSALEPFSDVVLVGARTPVSFFGYEGLPSIPVPETTRVHTLAEPHQDVLDALTTLADATGSATSELPPVQQVQISAPEGALDAARLAAAIVLTQPDNAIIVNEGVTSAASYPKAAGGAPRHTELALTGGAIGMGIPVATGAAVACPDRPVINLQADGSGFYTLQGLWTQARERLNVTTVICANQRYRILEAELQRAGVERPGAAANGMTSLADPATDWTALASGFGVPAVRATTGPELLDALRHAHAEPGPHLIEAILP